MILTSSEGCSLVEPTKQKQLPANSPPLQEFHPNVTDDATLLNNTQVGFFFYFESMNLSLHSSFPAHSDYVDIFTKTSRQPAEDE